MRTYEFSWFWYAYHTVPSITWLFFSLALSIWMMQWAAAALLWKCAHWRHLWRQMAAAWRQVDDQRQQMARAIESASGTLASLDPNRLETGDLSCQPWRSLSSYQPTPVQFDSPLSFLLSPSGWYCLVHVLGQSQATATTQHPIVDQFDLIVSSSIIAAAPLK